MRWWEAMLSDEELADLMETWLPRGGRVLDVGCGSGHALRVLLERGYTGLGVDPYPHTGEVPSRPLQAEEIGQLEQRFDLIYTAYALHHFQAPRRFVREASRALASRGVLVLVDWVEGTDVGIPETYLSPEAVALWLVEAGFRLIRDERRGPTMILAGRREDTSCPG